MRLRIIHLLADFPLDDVMGFLICSIAVQVMEHATIVCVQSIDQSKSCTWCLEKRAISSPTMTQTRTVGLQYLILAHHQSINGFQPIY